MVTHQLQVERRTAKERWPETDVLPLAFNASKYKVTHFGKKDYISTDYYMNGQRLLTVTEERDLGVVISSYMKSSQQCIQAYSKASRLY